MALPPLTPEQRAADLEKSIAARKAAREVEPPERGKITVADASSRARTARLRKMKVHRACSVPARHRCGQSPTG